MARLKRLAFSCLALAALPLAGCGRAVDMSCEEIAKQATELSKKQPVQITNLTNIREVSRTDKEKRCSATATTSVGTTEEVVLKGYEDSSGNQMVGYDGQGTSQ